MKTSDYDYYLPKELIAQEPAEKRDHSRLMVLDRKNQTIDHKYFYDIVDYLKLGDLLVLNDTKVIPANLVGKKEGGGARVEILLGKQLTVDSNQYVFECLVRPGKRLGVGSKVIFGNGELMGRVLEKKETGEQIIEFRHFDNCQSGKTFWEVVNELGEIPLPPYIKLNPKSEIRNPKQILSLKSKLSKRYQTVYAKALGASAAPTAGLHFTEDLLEEIKSKGIKIAYVTLHTGIATFRPVWAEKVEDHKMHSEYFEIPKETIQAVRKAKRVIAVGTTTVRALESMENQINATKTLRLKEIQGETELFIYPGYKFKIVDAMITNFHWPRSTLIMLVSAFAGRDFILKAYQEAIQRKYRFYSFGDAMLIV